MDPVQIVDPPRKSRSEMVVGKVPVYSEVLLQEDFGECPTRSTRLLPLLGCTGFGPSVKVGSIGVRSNERPDFRIHLH